MNAAELRLACLAAVEARGEGATVPRAVAWRGRGVPRRVRLFGRHGGPLGEVADWLPSRGVVVAWFKAAAIVDWLDERHLGAGA